MRTSCSVGFGLSRRNSVSVVSIPGVQKPHCRPWLSRNASCSGLSLSGLGASPSTVVIEWPSACTASIRQERAERSSNRMVQAPHTPCSQPRCVPVSPIVWRRKSASVSRTSTSASCRVPFTVNAILRVSPMVPSMRRGLAAGPQPRACLFKRAACHHGREVLPVGGRRVHVVQRLERPTALARIAQEFVVRHVADERLLDRGGAHRRRAHAAERNRGARDLAGGLL